MKNFEKTVRIICMALSFVGFAALVIMMVIVTGDVVFRAILKRAILGTTEIAQIIVFRKIACF